jgi:hypothetical protein
MYIVRSLRLYLPQLVILLSSGTSSPDTFLAVEHNIIVSSSTLSRNLIEAGITHKKLHKLALERDEILRDE